MTKEKPSREEIGLQLLLRYQESAERLPRTKFPKNLQNKSQTDYHEEAEALLAKRKKCDPLNPIRGKIEGKCSECDRAHDCAKDLLFFSQIPHWLIDNYLPLLTPTEWKVFTILCRHAKFARSQAGWGRCHIKYQTISEGAGIGISEIPKYLKKLEALNLIRHKQWQDTDKRTGKRFTMNRFTINHIKLMPRIKRRA